MHRWHCRSEDPVKSPGYNRIRGTKPGVAYLLVGSALYLVGTVLVTSAFNVPRNEALAAVDPVSTDAANLWAGYVTNWTIWNHVRTAPPCGGSIAHRCAQFVTCPSYGLITSEDGVGLFGNSHFSQCILPSFILEEEHFLTILSGIQKLRLDRDRNPPF